MTNIENIFENIINGYDGGDSALSTIYENPCVRNVNPLEVNGPSPNLIVLSDNSRSGGGSVDRSDGPLDASTKGSIDESSKEDGEGNSNNLDLGEWLLVLLLLSNVIWIRMRL